MLTLLFLRPIGYAAGLVNKANQSAGEIVDELLREAYEVLRNGSKLISSTSKL